MMRWLTQNVNLFWFVSEFFLFGSFHSKDTKDKKEINGV